MTSPVPPRYSTVKRVVVDVIDSTTGLAVTTFRGEEEDAAATYARELETRETGGPPATATPA